MITIPNDWDNIQESGGFPQLPAGGYVVHIIDAEVKTAESGYTYLDLTIDISEGAYENYYTKEFKAQTYEPKRFKGHLRQGVPKNDGTEKDEFSKRGFKGLISAVEHSNEGFVAVPQGATAFDEKTLVGKQVGCLFRSEEYNYNGRQGMSTRPWRAVSADRIRTGTFKIPTPKYLEHSDPRPQQTGPATVTFDQVKDEDIPF